MLVGEAIENKQLVFDKYFAIDAAVALEAYGQVAEDEGMLRVDNWLDYWNHETTDSNGTTVNPDRKLLASEWHTLFDQTDNRHLLTWRNRLFHVPGLNVYNFYSSTEDVLRRYDEDNILIDGNGWTKEAMATSSWVKQEKFKGRRSEVFFDIGGATSSYCGWSFNSEWDVAKEPLEYDEAGNPVKVRRIPAQAAPITEDELMKKPFFNLPTFRLLDPDLGELVSDNPSDLAPSEFVMKNISETDLTNYYDHNEPAHDKVKVRDWLLAEAFPATTLPMGANENGKLNLPGQNIDMSGVRNADGGCCKTSEGLWPDDRKGEWKHSDYKNISYQHVYEFYRKIKELINQ
jgi:hypothetical protein